VAAELAALDPANAARYRANASAFRARLGELDAALRAQLAPVRGVPYLVFHDAYQYFEQHYGLSPAGAVTVSPEQRPGGRRVAQLRALIERHGVRCVFREPQFQPALVEAITRGNEVRVGVLDPEGAAIPPGPEQYPRLLRDLGDALAGCLGG
jgi:zinc transport system substrate-binding protein